MQDKNIQELISLYHSGEFNTVEKKISKLINMLYVLLFFKN